MRRLLPFAAAAVCCLAPHAPAHGQQPAPAGKAAPAPAVTLEPAKAVDEKLFAREQREIGGKVFRLSEYRGRVFVVNVWATWCGPCWLEIPGFNKVYEDYSPRGVEFVGLTMNDPTNDADKVLSAARELKMKYRLAWLDYPTAEALMGTRKVIPQTFVVGADGRVVLHVRGYNPRVPEMIRAAVSGALARRPGAAAPTPPPAAAPASAAPRP
ncbi:MAG TPA: TlpA disulfide reductase family protein [Pyrinomonadaceae bacterium]|jgi:thiol-disulfide isomerase/thioredoxin